jgi:putative acetyltransferase
MLPAPEIARTDRDDPSFLALVEELDKDLWERYPSSQGAYVAGNKIAAGASVVVCLMDGQAVGCGCFREYEKDFVELKRMYMKPSYRGKRLASTVLGELEAWAREKGARAMVLETGKNQPEAIRLYEKSGFVRVPNYGEYAGNAESICMSKSLTREGEERT